MFQFKNLSKKLGNKIIAQNINLTTEAGEMVAILGASGSGKSTLLQMAVGLQKVDAGEIWLNGENITFRQPEKREMAMMFQDFALLPHLNVWENVALGLRLRGVAKSAAKTQAHEILAQVKLSYATDCAIAQLSGGEQQRVALARALVVQPKLLLLDEPFSSLDTALRHQLQEEIAQLVRAHRIPTLLVSHDPAEAALTAQRMALLADGQIIQQGTPDELFARPISAQAARLLGCLNVSETHYIPPQAIVFNGDTECVVQQFYRQSTAWRIHLRHPIWGDLIAFSPDMPKNSTVQISLDHNQIVHFQAD